jgi:hypothetical protein
MSGVWYNIIQDYLKERPRERIKDQQEEGIDKDGKKKETKT